jgi:heme A synthase
MTATLGIVLAGLVILVLRRYPRGHVVRRSYGWALGFFFGEVIIGAVLVVFGWVEDDASVGRVIAVSVHLINTFLLLGALALTAYFASGGAPIRFDRSRRRDQAIIAGVITLLVIGASGALNALSDTLFPADTVLEGIRAEFGSTAPFLLRIRTVHPLIAIAGGGIIFVLARSPVLEATGRAARFAGWAQALVGLQFIMGLINIALLTPVETQVLHLLLADALWLVWVLLGAELLGVRQHVPAPVGDPA